MTRRVAIFAEPVNTRLHLHRGISYLATPHLVRCIADLVRVAEEKRAV